MQTFLIFLSQTSNFCHQICSLLIHLLANLSVQRHTDQATDRQRVWSWMTNLSLRLRKLPDTLPTQSNSPQGAVHISACLSAHFSSLLSLSSPFRFCLSFYVSLTVLLFLSFSVPHGMCWEAFIPRSHISSLKPLHLPLPLIKPQMTHTIILNRVT